ncbi:MAG: extracellular solute-binding protein [Thermoanaerobaculum sp.]|nr:extracellular solute-binding protein [Thermoanaerobaculum sp.]MDW7968330.1 extracellular solute-binding protein [Thermoanaerobaculum sp.]
MGLLLLVSLACSAPREPVSLSLLTALSGSDAAALQEHLNAIAATVEPVTVRLHTVPLRALEDTVLAFNPHTAGGRWDLAVVPTSWIHRLHQRQAILEVPNHHVLSLQQTVMPLALLATSVQGQVMGYPLSANVEALVLNPHLFPHVPTSLAALTRTPLPPGVLPLGVNLRDPAQVLPLLASWETLPPDATPPALAQLLRRFLLALQPATAQRDLFNLWMTSTAPAVQAQLFAEGRLAALVSGPQVLGLLETLQKPLVVTPLPAVCEGCSPPKPWARVTAVVVSNVCPYPDLAQQLALELTTLERNVQLNLAMNLLPVAGGADESQILAKSPALFGFQRALASARVLKAAELSETWNAWEKALALVMQEPQQERAGSGQRGEL